MSEEDLKQIKAIISAEILSAIEPLRKDISELRNDSNRIKNDLCSLKGEVRSLEGVGSNRRRSRLALVDGKPVQKGITGTVINHVPPELTGRK